MQSELLDITIIGCLVLLFASTYRKRATPMVRYWTLGWLLVLVHFTALLFHPAGQWPQCAFIILSLSALLACGVVFLLAAVTEEPDAGARFALPITAGIAAISFIVLFVCGETRPQPYYLCAAVGVLCWLAFEVRLRSQSITIRASLLLSTVGSTAWLFWALTQGRLDIGINAIVTQLYLVVALAYVGTFRRISAGTLTVFCGLLAWAAVFPASAFCRHLGIIQRISPEFWNVPKYFVAFGMVLMLLEEEIIAASKARKYYQLLFDANPHPMWIYDRQTLAFEGVNDAAIAQYGYTRDQFLRMTLNDLEAAEPGLPHTAPRQYKRSDGSLCFVDIATHNIENNGRQLAFSLVQDVTDREQLHQFLLYQAHHDLLTTLPNRAWLEEKLRETLTRSGPRLFRSALLCLDVDRFKQINDTYGHSIGDICLQEVARRLAYQMRGLHSAARVGGEEFGLVIHEISSVAEAEQIATEVLRALQAPIYANTYTIELTASIGIAVYPDDGPDAATLWRNADAAMYRAKRAGGNQYLCMSPEISLRSSEANELELHVRHALRTGGFEVHYQPLYSIDGALYGLEALVRLRHPEHGLISPQRFITIAEERALIVPLGSWVLNEVCEQLGRWQREGLSLVRVDLNISPLQITRPDFAAQVLAALAAHNLDPRRIGMEITETAMMRNIAEASRQIKLLAAAGIAFSIDDFGTGYSSLGQLDKLPVQTLKIDRTFIDRICRSDGTYSIVDAIISMAHGLRLNVVAEGVETHEQWACLRHLKCDIVQGFLFSKPLNATDMTTLLRSGVPPLLLQPKNRIHVA